MIYTNTLFIFWTDHEQKGFVWVLQGKFYEVKQKSLRQNKVKLMELTNHFVEVLPYFVIFLKKNIKILKDRKKKIETILNEPKRILKKNKMKIFFIYKQEKKLVFFFEQ